MCVGVVVANGVVVGVQRLLVVQGEEFAACRRHRFQDPAHVIGLGDAQGLVDEDAVDGPVLRLSVKARPVVQLGAVVRAGVGAFDNGKSARSKIASRARRTAPRVPLRRCTAMLSAITRRLASWLQAGFQSSTDNSQARKGSRAAGQRSGFRMWRVSTGRSARCCWAAAVARSRKVALGGSRSDIVAPRDHADGCAIGRVAVVDDHVSGR